MSVFVATTRAELVAALTAAPAGEPRIIYVDGTIDLNVDDDNSPLACTDYYRNGYTLEGFLAFYDPAGPWGPNPPANTMGSLEAARRASAAAQSARIRLRVPDHTTIVGVDNRATLRGGWLDLRGTTAARRQNVIIRNITFEDVYDCFPATNASDRVTVSSNRFRNHDKTMLIGSSDTATADVGRLRVTLHHNLFENIGQRAPRVRYGQLHVYNNYYVIPDPDVHGYSWGVGVQPLPVASGIFAENNYFRTAQSVTPGQFIARFTNGRAIHAAGTLHNAAAANHAVDRLAAYNAVRDPDLLADVGWVPSTHLAIDPTLRVPSLTESESGPLNW